MDFNAFYEGDKSWELDNEGLMEQLEAFQEQLTRMGAAIGHTIYHLEKANEVGANPDFGWWGDTTSDWLREEAEGALCAFYELAGEFASDVAGSVGVKVQASSSSSSSTISSE